jgi:outer membrane protein assembly factor BamB
MGIALLHADDRAASPGPIFLLCLLAIGCGHQQDSNKKENPRAHQDPPVSSTIRNARDGRSSKSLDREPAGTPGSDWPNFLGPLGTSVSTETDIVTTWSDGGLRVVWKKALGVGHGMPAVSNGRLFLFDRQDDTARLRCLKRTTGETVWSFEYPTDFRDDFGYNNGPRCCPVVDSERVYIYGAEGMLHCLGARDGKKIWAVDTVKKFHVVPNFFGVSSAPVVEGDLLIVQVGGSPEGTEVSGFQDEGFADLKGDKSAVVAFDKLTGKVKYRIGDELASCAGPVLATINGRRWCFVLARGGLIGFDPACGKVDFHFPWRAPDLASVNASNPVVVGDRVFISETYGPGSALLKVRPGAYEVLWTDAKKPPRKKSLQCHWSTPIYHDGYLYGCSGRHDYNAELRCIELATGRVMWSKPGLTRTSLLMVDGHFVCLGEEGQLLLLKVNPRKYQEVSRADTEGLLRYPCWAAPILAHGLMYVRGPDTLVCFELIPKKR